MKMFKISKYLFSIFIFSALMKTCQQCDWTYKFELYSFKAPHLPLKQKYDVDCKGGLHLKTAIYFLIKNNMFCMWKQSCKSLM